MDEIEIVEYDPGWPALYEEEAARVRRALPAAAIAAMEHFGSTAVPGLAAKPIIDILIAVKSIAQARSTFVSPLAEIGYAFWADNPAPDRLFFVKGLPPRALRRTHHVHVTEPHGEMWRRLAFRDFLRRHPDEAARYAALKRDLAAAHPSDREAYTRAKDDYVAAVMAKADGEARQTRMGIST